jgi:type II secretory pathway pseudopilin PulG
MFKKYLSSQAGFTLIEAIAVIGVLAVTTAVLVVNNRINELQLNLNTDIAGVANAISRAKALTLQGVGASEGICGYGVSFDQGLNDAPDTYSIYSYTDCKTWTKGDVLAGQGGVNNFSSGLRILNLTAVGADSQFIKDVIFYSSDARVKLLNFGGQSICEVGCTIESSAGIIVINTESFPTSFMTLKIATTGQVTSKPGAYSSSQNFDSGSEMILTIGEGGSFSYSGENTEGSSEEDGEASVFEEDMISCIPNCFCALGLPSGETCSDGCGGTCYAGTGQEPCERLATDCQAPNNTCADFDSCGARCAVCGDGFVCNPDVKQCELCSCDDVGGTVDTCGLCFGACIGCAGSGAGYTCNTTLGVCEIGDQDLKLEGVWPPIGYK